MKVERQLPDRFGGRKYEEVDVTGNNETFKAEYLEYIREAISFKPGLLHNVADTVVWVGAGSVFSYLISGLAMLGYPVLSLVAFLILVGVFGYGLLVVATKLQFGTFLICVRLTSFLVGAFLMVL